MNKKEADKIYWNKLENAMKHNPSIFEYVYRRASQTGAIVFLLLLTAVGYYILTTFPNIYF